MLRWRRCDFSTFGPDRAGGAGLGPRIKQNKNHLISQLLCDLRVAINQLLSIKHCHVLFLWVLLGHAKVSSLNVVLNYTVFMVLFSVQRLAA
jgi:hypothetical protein